MSQFSSVLITGASSGLGAALAAACAAPGVVLHLSGRDAGRLEEVAAACRAKGAQVEARILDVADAAAMNAWISGAGPLDLVIANAGMLGAPANGRIETAAELRAIFDVNLHGVLNTVLPALAAMARQPAGADGWRGRIAVVASVAAFFAAPSVPGYCASKAAADSWTVATAANARGRGVLMTSICPGNISTPMIAGHARLRGAMEPDQAAGIILRGVAAGRRRVVFPWWRGGLARLRGLLPPALVARGRKPSPQPDAPGG